MLHPLDECFVPLCYYWITQQLPPPPLQHGPWAQSQVATAPICCQSDNPDRPDCHRLTTVWLSFRSIEIIASLDTTLPVNESRTTIDGIFDTLSRARVVDTEKGVVGKRQNPVPLLKGCDCGSALLSSLS